MSGISFIIIDIETTGLKTNFHEITEVSCIRASDKIQLFRQIKCERPENANYDALKITGKKLSDLSIGISKEEMIEAVDGFLRLDGATSASTCVIGHNVQFDRKFLFSYWENKERIFPCRYWLDTQDLVKFYLKHNDVSSLPITKTATGRISTTLTASCEMLGVKKFQDAHNAKADTRNTYFLWKTLTEDYGIDYLPFIKTNIHKIESEVIEQITDDDLEPTDEEII